MRAIRRLSALLVALGVIWPPVVHAGTEQVVAADDVRADVAVDAQGNAFLVGRSRSSVRLRVAAPGPRFGPWRTLYSSANDRAVDAAVAADGTGVIVIQSRGRQFRRVKVAAFSARGSVAPAVVVSHGERADFAASALAPGGAAVVVWFRHRDDGRWRLEASTREPGDARFGPPRPLSRYVRRPCCTHVSVAIGDRGDAVATWTSTARPSVWVAQRRPGVPFGRQQRLADESSDVPMATVGAGGTATVIYSLQRVPRHADDGLQLHRAVNGGPFGPAEHVNPGGGVTIGQAEVTAGGRVLVAWADGPGIHVSEAGPGEPLNVTAELGARVAPQRLAVAADDAGRAAVAWSEIASTDPVYRERAKATMRQVSGAPFGPGVALGQPWRNAAPVLLRLVPGGGALAVWTGTRFGDAAAREGVLVVTRLP